MNQPLTLSRDVHIISLRQTEVLGAASYGTVTSEEGQRSGGREVLTVVPAVQTEVTVWPFCY